MHFVPVELFILEIKNTHTKRKFLWLTLVGPQIMAVFKFDFRLVERKLVLFREKTNNFGLV